MRQLRKQISLLIIPLIFFLSSCLQPVVTTTYEAPACPPEPVCPKVGLLGIKVEMYQPDELVPVTKQEIVDVIECTAIKLQHCRACNWACEEGYKAIK